MPADRDVVKLKQSLISFGFTVTFRGPRVFCVWPQEERVFILRKLARAGFWEFNESNRPMWEEYGAMGFTVFQAISTAEMIKWLYDHATECLKKYGKPENKYAPSTKRKMGFNQAKPKALDSKELRVEAGRKSAENKKRKANERAAKK